MADELSPQNFFCAYGFPARWGTVTRGKQSHWSPRTFTLPREPQALAASNERRTMPQPDRLSPRSSAARKNLKAAATRKPAYRSPNIPKRLLDLRTDESDHTSPAAWPWISGGF